MKTPPKVTTSIELITPEIAKKYLDLNLKHQRNVTNSHVLHLSQQMESGQWVMTGEPIIFDEDGNHVDGQHRLHAIVKSGCSVMITVTRGVPRDAFKAMGRGKVRTGGNIFTIAGYSNGNDLAAATSGVINYRRAMTVKSEWEKKDRKNEDGKMVRAGYNPGSLNSYIRASTTDMIDEYEKNLEAYAIAMNCLFIVKPTRLLPPSVVSTVAALALIESSHTEQEVKAFWECFESGAGLTSNDPIWVLRERCRKNASEKSKLSHNMLVMLVIKSWNAYIKNKSLSLIRVMDGEPCPTIL